MGRTHLCLSNHEDASFLIVGTKQVALTNGVVDLANKCFMWFSWVSQKKKIYILNMSNEDILTKLNLKQKIYILNL